MAIVAQRRAVPTGCDTTPRTACGQGGTRTIAHVTHRKPRATTHPPAAVPAHHHHFHTDTQAAERGTRAVLWITLSAMVVEITAGWWLGSMALLADGWHMSSHAVAIGVTALAYAAARRLANNHRFAFGTWKIEVLGGFASAWMPLGVAALMLVASVDRYFDPQPIRYREAVFLAVLGEWDWLGPLMGVVGAVLVAVWAKGLIRDTSTVLLDREMDHPVVADIREVVEQLAPAGSASLTDLHVWRVGRDSFACTMTVASTQAELTPHHVRHALAVHNEVVHATIEVHHEAARESRLAKGGRRAHGCRCADLPGRRLWTRTPPCCAGPRTCPPPRQRTPPALPRPYACRPAQPPAPTLKVISSEVSSLAVALEPVLPLLADQQRPAPVNQPIGSGRQDKACKGKSHQQGGPPGYDLLPEDRRPGRGGCQVPLDGRCGGLRGSALWYDKGAEIGGQRPDGCHGEGVREPGGSGGGRHISPERHRRQHRGWHLQRQWKHPDANAQRNASRDTPPVHDPEHRVPV